MAEVYMIPTQNIKDSTFIDDNVEDRDIKISTLDAQEQLLEPKIGSGLYNKLIDDILNKTVEEDYQERLVYFIWPYLYQAVVYKLSYNLLFRYTRSAVTKDSNDNSNAVDIDEINVMIRERELGMNYHAEKLIVHLTAYPERYPEFLGEVPEDGQEPDLTNDSMSFWNYDLS